MAFSKYSTEIIKSPNSLSLACIFHFSIIGKRETKNQKQQQFLIFSVTSESYIWLLLETQNAAAFVTQKYFFKQKFVYMLAVSLSGYLSAESRKINIRTTSTKNHWLIIVFIWPCGLHQFEP